MPASTSEEGICAVFTRREISPAAEIHGCTGLSCCCVWAKKSPQPRSGLTVHKMGRLLSAEECFQVACKGRAHDPNDWSCQSTNSSHLWLTIRHRASFKSNCAQPLVWLSCHSRQASGMLRGENVKNRRQLKATICTKDDAWDVCMTIFAVRFSRPLLHCALLPSTPNYLLLALHPRQLTDTTTLV